MKRLKKKKKNRKNETAAEQKIRQFKKLLLKSKRFEKDKAKRIKPNDLKRFKSGTKYE